MAHKGSSSAWRATRIRVARRSAAAGPVHTFGAGLDRFHGADRRNLGIPATSPRRSAHPARPRPRRSESMEIEAPEQSAAESFLEDALAGVAVGGYSAAWRWRGRGRTLRWCRVQRGSADARDRRPTGDGRTAARRDVSMVPWTRPRPDRRRDLLGIVLSAMATRPDRSAAARAQSAGPGAVRGGLAGVARIAMLAAVRAGASCDARRSVVALRWE